jgi:hypothetical protein
MTKLDLERTYSLRRDELAGEIRRLRQAGWQDWEIRDRFNLKALATPPETQDAR